ncbi:3920_t:CDS:2 [Dentiscutata heterogama]|uniref:3920_t:CDS:1 n=1 Tax=Dentiscutata heterogama TaxID=1316150 RepID=A0ACA9KEU7_9GLOM|nr:3920_t:CDS:2 [Dentiscutata heterogama]
MPNSTSKVWKFFDKNDDNILCKLCENKKYSKKCSTTTLARHLRSKYPAQYIVIQAPSNTHHHHPYSRELQRPITDALLEWIVIDLQPFTTDLMTILRPIYEATTFLSSASHPTISDIRVAFTGMTIELEAYLNPTASQYSVALAINNKLKEYWNYYFDIHSSIPAVLDP